MGSKGGLVEIRILFGTETGNAEDCAFQLGDALEDNGFDANVTDMAAYNPSDLAREKLAIVVTSTYGNGDPPHNAEATMAWLSNPDSSVKGLSFAVCGLGDQTYPRFGQAGIDFDRLMEERGGNRVVPRQDCDVDYEGPFEEFMDSIVDWLKANGDSLNSDLLDETVPPQPITQLMPKAEVKVGTRGAPVIATLTQRRRLNRTGSSKETWHYEFEWPGVDVDFTPGDSFAVVPENNPREVRAILEALNLDGGSQVQVADCLMRLDQALVTARDLQTVSYEVLSALTVGGVSRLTASVDNLESYLSGRHLIDVIRENPGGQIQAQALVDGLKRLKPRLYSVASSPLVEAQGVHFTVETLRYDWNGRTREGVATTWLADRVEDGGIVPMYCVQAAHFRLPSDPDVPIIMVGPGTGVAPFRAFLQHRQAQGAAGKSWLFFGHQHRETDFLYQSELESWVANGTLSALSLAWSRDQDRKVYVQDLVRENGAKIWLWMSSGAYMYVCGDKNAMAPQVREAFVNAAVVHGGLVKSVAAAMIDEWEKQGRYSVDAY